MEFALYMNGLRGASVGRRCTGEGRFVRQMGPPGRFGVIDLVLEPVTAERPGPCLLSWEVDEARLPLFYLDSVVSGVKQVMTEAAFAGDYLYATRIRVVGGAYHETDSKLSCFCVATVLALRQALTQAGLYVAAPVDGADAGQPR